MEATGVSHIATLFRRVATELENLAEDLQVRLAAGRVQSVMDDVDRSATTAAAEPPVRPLLTVDDLARVLRVDSKTVRRWRSEGKLPDAIELGGVVRWHPDVVGAWLRGGGA